MAAAAKVSANIRVLVQMIGACGSVEGLSGMRVCGSSGVALAAEAQWGPDALPQERGRNLARLPARCRAGVVVFEYAAAPETPFSVRQSMNVTRFRAFARGVFRRLVCGALLAGAWLALVPAAQGARAYVSNQDDPTVP